MSKRPHREPSVGKTFIWRCLDNELVNHPRSLFFLMFFQFMLNKDTFVGFFEAKEEFDTLHLQVFEVEVLFGGQHAMINDARLVKNRDHQ